MPGFFDALQRNLNGGDYYDQKSRTLNERFIDDLNKMSDDENYIPKISSADMKYNFALQQRRLKDHGITLKRKYMKEENSTSGVSMLMGNDKRYINRIPFISCRCESAFVKDDKIRKKIKSKETLYSYTVFVENQDTNASYCCPNCGDVNTVSQLLETGCRSCGTRFIMSDLYPRITNYYALKQKDYTLVPFFPFMLLWTFVMIVFLVTSVLKQQEELYMIILNLLFGIPMGMFFGYIFYGISSLFLLIPESIVGSIRLFSYNKTKSKLPRFMQHFDPYFSIDFFVGKVNNLLRTLVFTDSYDNCAIYEQTGENPYKDIIDIEYQGIIGLNSVKNDENFVYADINIYTKTTYCSKDKIRRKEDVFRMKIQRAIGVYDDCNASIHNVNCRSCGASFDAVREKNCPYCGNAYDLKQYDWVVTEFSRKTSVG
ncbi:MAG: hypothetical protein J1E83_05710 [Lachnospiraceae bacterium]|nr:hypothetical protein [Lachnospiraceae bacterium]